MGDFLWFGGRWQDNRTSDLANLIILHPLKNHVNFTPSSFVHRLVYEVDKGFEVYQPNQPHEPYQPMHHTTGHFPRNAATLATHWLSRAIGINRCELCGVAWKMPSRVPMHKTWRCEVSDCLKLFDMIWNRLKSKIHASNWSNLL
jgi:hypothetical protein